LLFDFRKYWQANFSHVQRDVTHLFTGNYSGSGIAYQGETCKFPNYTYGLTGKLDFSRTWKIFAHETGHNLGAEHVQATGDCQLSLMTTGIYPLTEERFCQTSINQIKTYVNNYGSCLQPIITTNKTKFDFDGDGKADISVFRRSDGFWYIMKSSGGFSFTKWGLARDVSVPGDYDGDGRTDVAVYRHGEALGTLINNAWYILRSSDNTFLIRDWGIHAGSLYGVNTRNKLFHFRALFLDPPDCQFEASL
jgi:hypothetical protein